MLGSCPMISPVPAVLFLTAPFTAGPVYAAPAEIRDLDC